MSDLDDSDDESNVDGQDGNLDAVDCDGILSKNFYTFEKIVDIDGDIPGFLDRFGCKRFERNHHHPKRTPAGREAVRLIGA